MVSRDVSHLGGCRFELLLQPYTQVFASWDLLISVAYNQQAETALIV